MPHAPQAPMSPQQCGAEFRHDRNCGVADNGRAIRDSVIPVRYCPEAVRCRPNFSRNAQNKCKTFAWLITLLSPSLAPHVADCVHATRWRLEGRMGEDHGISSRT